MPDTQENPTDPRPDQASTGNAAPDNQTNQPEEQSPDQAATNTTTSAPIPSSTQQNMGDGTGIRGDYGDASQTNGLEGGPDKPQTDTELMGS
jgi:hypothetical protein